MKHTLIAACLALIILVNLAPAVAAAPPTPTYSFNFENTYVDEIGSTQATTCSGASLTTSNKKIGNYALNAGSYCSAEFMSSVSSFSFCGWFYQTSRSGAQQLYGTYDGGNNVIQLSINGTGYPAYQAWNGGSNVITANTAVPLNTWTHVCFTGSNSGRTIYLNGNSVATGSGVGLASFTCNTNTCRLLAEDSRSNTPFIGQADQLMLYKNYVLTSSDVSQLYNNGNGYAFNATTVALTMSVNDTRANTLVAGFTINYTTTNASDANPKTQYCPGLSCTVTNYSGTINVSVYNVSNNTYFPTTLTNAVLGASSVTAVVQTYKNSLTITSITNIIDGTNQTYCANVTSAGGNAQVQCSGPIINGAPITATFSNPSRAGVSVCGPPSGYDSTLRFCQESGYTSVYAASCGGSSFCGFWNGAEWHQTSPNNLAYCTSITCWNGASVGITANMTFYNVAGNMTLSIYNISNATFANITVPITAYNASTSTYALSSYQAVLNVTAVQGGTNLTITAFNVTNGRATNTTTNGYDLIFANLGGNNIRVDVLGNASMNFTAIATSAFGITPFIAYGIYDNVTNVSGSGAPVTSAYNCTSCNPPSGSTTSPYLTSDTTPTFRVNTNVNANCRIASQDWNYTAMGATRSCATGDGLTRHICTLTSQDALSAESGSVYIACQGMDGSESAKSTSGPLAITGVATTPQAAIDYGIHQSVVWPQATVYQNQQVYLRDLNNNQKLATVDRVVVFGNQRWLINYHNGSALGLFNLSSVVYSLDLWDTNITLLQIESNVTSFINATKQ
jgi:hypothetical protein